VCSLSAFFFAPFAPPAPTLLAAELTEKIMENRKSPESSLRSALGIIRLNKKYPAVRMEAACKKALNFSLYRYRNVKNILDKHLENDFIENKSEKTIAHENICGADFTNLHIHLESTDENEKLEKRQDIYKKRIADISILLTNLKDFLVNYC